MTITKVRLAARLLLLEPEWSRSCAECQQWEYNDEEDSPPGRRGLPLLTPDTGEKIPRVSRPPCVRCPKVPEPVRAERQRTGERVVPADAVEPEARHWQIVEHDLECRAVGRWPNHPLVRRNARIVGDIVRVAQDRPLQSLMAQMSLLLRHTMRA